ncbi:FUSC family protein [Pseudonocardia nantongensis]|uniref:FUSC family protein n=1 Tax=Pseudonocardia nantongensis TaxID=1181885 RepID=UPI003979BB73
MLIVKSALAASLAWFVANDLLGAPSATFAPFSALLMVQVTISQSLFQSLRYAAAVIAGAVVTGLLIPALGATMAAFAVLMLAGLTIGRWHKLGSQGPQVAVAALFAYASFTQSDPQSSYLQLVSIAGLVVLGCVIGVVINLLVVPPMRFRSGAYVVDSLSRSLCDLLTDVADGLTDGMPDDDQVSQWSYRAGRIPDLAEQARTSIEHAAESMRFNPRRLFMRQSTDFSGYRVTVCAFQRANEQVMSVCRSLRHSSDARESPHGTDRVLGELASVLHAAAEATRVLGSIHHVVDLDRASDLDEPLDRGRDAIARASEQVDTHDLDHGRDGPIYTGLLTDARRLIEEYGEARHQLAQQGDPESQMEG